MNFLNIFYNEIVFCLKLYKYKRSLRTQILNTWPTNIQQGHYHVQLLSNIGQSKSEMPDYKNEGLLFTIAMKKLFLLNGCL